MEIVICPNHNFIMPSGVMLKSLFLSNPHKEISVHVLADNDVTSKDQEDLEEIVSFHRCKIYFYKIDGGKFDNYPGLKGNVISRSAYFRLFLSEILPKNIEKVLYLDGDIVIRKSIEQLWNIELDGYAIGCVMDMLAGKIQIYNRLCIPSELTYFNSGVLLINLRYWRENNLVDDYVNYINNNYNKISAAVDQDVLNNVLMNKTKMLPLTYNVQEGFFFKPEYAEFDYWKNQEDVSNAINDPIILHFTGGMKPWNKGCNHPRKKDFFYYQKQTKWANIPLQEIKKSFRRKSKDTILLLLSILKVINRPTVEKYVKCF